MLELIKERLGAAIAIAAFAAFSFGAPNFVKADELVTIMSFSDTVALAKELCLVGTDYTEEEYHGAFTETPAQWKCLKGADLIDKLSLVAADAFGVDSGEVVIEHLAAAASALEAELRKTYPQALLAQNN